MPPSSFRTKLRVVRKDVVEGARKVGRQAANVEQNHRAVRVVECRGAVELGDSRVALCLDRRLGVSRKRFQCCFVSHGVLGRAEYLGEVRGFTSDEGTVSNSVKSSRASQWAEFAFGSFVQWSDCLKHERPLRRVAQVPRDEVVQEVRELAHQVGVAQSHAQVFGCPNRYVFSFSPLHHSEVVRDFVHSESPSHSLCQMIEPVG